MSDCVTLLLHIQDMISYVRRKMPGWDKFEIVLLKSIIRTVPPFNHHLANTLAYTLVYPGILRYLINSKFRDVIRYTRYQVCGMESNDSGFSL